MASTKLVVERVFEAPVEKVWQAWADPEQIKKWWGPKNFSAPHITSDFKEAGKFVFCMRGSVAPGLPEADFWNCGSYTQIIPMQKIVATMSFADEHGNPVPASRYNMPGDWPTEVTLEITFEDAGNGKTKLTVQESGVPKEMSKFAAMGWEQQFDKMVENFKH